MISQPVEVHRDHSGLRVNLQTSNEVGKTRRTDHPVPQNVMIYVGEEGDADVEPEQGARR